MTAPCTGAAQPRKTNMTHNTTALSAITTIALFAVGCQPGGIDPNPDSTESSTGGDETETGGECDEPGTVICEPDEPCWAFHQSWSEYARSFSPDYLVDALDSGAFVPDGDCYLEIETNHRLCVIEQDCTPLLARPLSEIELVETECGDLGPWSFTGGTEPVVTDDCWGILGDFAVELRSLDAPAPTPDLVCVERDADEVTCWVPWGMAHARVLPACQVEEIQQSGVWAESFVQYSAVWETITCYTLTGADYTFCLASPTNILLYYTAQDIWVPEIGYDIGTLTPAAPPC